MRKRWWGLVIGLLCGVATASLAHAADAQKEYLVKAAFIYNFIKFVDWPSEASAQLRQINVCMLGGNPFAGPPQDVFRRASNEQLRITVVELQKDTSRISQCNILFIDRVLQSELSSILSIAARLPVLTVSEVPGFADAGGIVQFIMDDGKVKLIINAGAATQAGLKVDAQLLEIAQKVIR